MSNQNNKNISLKHASQTARKVLKRFSFSTRLKNIVFSVIVLAVGIALGIVFDEFELFLGIAVALDVVIVLINVNNNI